MKRDLIIKVCGMKDPINRQALEVLPIDIFGFIFYPPSPRNVNPDDLSNLRKLTDTQKNKAGVFVDSTAEQIMEIIQLAGLTYVQLHGSESPGFCGQIRRTGVSVIKAFRVNEQFDFAKTKPYQGTVDFLLFDTRAEKPGGTGKKFNWQILEKYKIDIPFFLSGGIGPADAESIINFKHSMLYGIDLNSGFEDEPSLKNFVQLKLFLHQLQNLKLEKK
jgi:phosphoribosylanthranilate isomerase